MTNKVKRIDADTVDTLVDALEVLMRKVNRYNEPAVRLAAHQGNVKAIALVREWDEEDGALDVPDTLHDGSPIMSIKDLSSVMGISEWSAAVYVQEKGVRHPLFKEASEVVKSEFSGTAALMLIPRNAGKFAVDGGVPAEQLHCTLFYSGDIKSMPVKTRDEFIDYARSLQLPIIDASLNGQTVFYNDPEKPVCVLNVDSPQLEAARRKVMDGLDVPQTHGYTPHMTVKYLGKGEGMPVIARQPVQVIFDRLRVAYDGKETDIDLVPAQTMDEVDVETKRGVRRVRTPAGMRHYGQPIGSVIVKDVLPEFDVRNARTANVKASTLQRGDVILTDDKNEFVRITDVRRQDGGVSLQGKNIDTGEDYTATHKKSSWIKKLVVGMLAVAAMAGTAFYGAGAALGDDTSPTHQTTVSGLPSQQQTPPAPRPAPTTAAGFNQMWEQVSVDQWGAADVAESVPLKDGRSVWLFGDTMSRYNGFVHSTAITQDGGNLHVSNNGKQLLPNDPSTEAGRKNIYWIEEGKAVGDSTIEVTAKPMSVGDANVWDFKERDTRSRVAVVTIDDTGDATFVKWKGYTPSPDQYQDLTEDRPGHYTYQRRAHPQFAMDSGKVLMGNSQNWSEPKKTEIGEIDYLAYRPVFTEGTGKEHKVTYDEWRASHQQKSFWEYVENKGIRRVRTPAGARHYGQPIGSIIVRDALPSLLDRFAGTRDEDGLNWNDGGIEAAFSEVVHQTDEYTVLADKRGSSVTLIIRDRIRGRRYVEAVDYKEWEDNPASRKKVAKKVAEKYAANFTKPGDPYYRYDGVRGFDWVYDDDWEMSPDPDDLDARWDWAFTDANELGIEWYSKGQEDAVDRLDVRAIETVNNVLRQHEEWFPGFTDSVIHKFNSQETYPGIPSALASATMPNGLAPDFPELTKSQITLYRHYWKGREGATVAQGRNSSLSNQWFSVNIDKVSSEHGMDTFTASAHATVVHEFGHAIINRIGTSKGVNFDQNFLEGIKDILIANDAWDESRGQPLNSAITREVSGYAASNVHELLAETWASYVLSSQPTELVEDIGRYMEEKLTEFMKGQN